MIPVEPAQQAIPRGEDVFASQAPGKCHVPCSDGVENSLVLFDHIARLHELVRLHLSDTEFDLAHQQAVHFCQPRAVLGQDESTVKVEIGPRQSGTIVSEHVLQQLAMNGEGRHR